MNSQGFSATIDSVAKTILKRFFAPPKSYFFLIGIILCALFFAFTFWVRSDSLRSFDFDMTVKIQSKVPLRLDPFFSLLSVVGRFDFTAPLLLIFLLIKRRITSAFPLLLFGLAHIIEFIGKTILEQPGPPRMFLRSQFSEFPGLHVFTESSYPSGHSLRIVFLGIVFLYPLYKSKFPRFIKALSGTLIIGLVFLMLVSRISLGEHWTTDVIGGSILGASFGILSLLLL